MEYITHYYRFDTEAEYLALVGDNAPDGAVDVVGEIEGTTGYHVNARWFNNQEPQAWAKYRIETPSKPVRVFA